MKVHELKTDSHNFDQIDNNNKLAEVRIDDRGYKTGCYLLLKETKHTGYEMAEMGMPLVYTGYYIMALVTHIHTQEGMKDDWKAMSIKVLSKVTRSTYANQL
jgi:hypothetical protein